MCWPLVDGLGASAMSLSVKMGSMGELIAVRLDAHAPPGVAAAVQHTKAQHTKGAGGFQLSAALLPVCRSLACINQCMPAQVMAGWTRAGCFVCCFAACHSSSLQVPCATLHCRAPQGRPRQGAAEARQPRHGRAGGAAAVKAAVHSRSPFKRWLMAFISLV